MPNQSIVAARTANAKLAAVRSTNPILSRISPALCGRADRDQTRSDEDPVRPLKEHRHPALMLPLILLLLVAVLATLGIAGRLEKHLLHFELIPPTSLRKSRSPPRRRCCNPAAPRRDPSAILGMPTDNATNLPALASSVSGVSAMKYFVLALIGLSLIAGTIDPCWADGETVAVFTKNQNNPFSQAIRTGSNIAAKNLVAKINHYIPSTPDSAAEQMRLVDDAIASKPDVVVFDPVDITALVPAVEKLNAAGIPVTNIADRIVSGQLVAYVGADDHKIGLETARHLLNAMGGRGNVVVLAGIQGSLTNTARLQGFNDALKEYPDAKLLAAKSGNYQRRQAQDVMESLLRSFPQIDGVIAANDAMAIGALEVLDKRNRKALVIGINGSKEAVELIKAGKLLASGEFSGFAIGCLGTETAILNLRKLRTLKELILKPVVIDTTNYHQYEARIEQRQCPKLDAEAKLNAG